MDFKSLFSIAPVWNDQLEPPAPSRESASVFQEPDNSGKALLTLLKYRKYVDSYNSVVINDIPKLLQITTQVRFRGADQHIYNIQLINVRHATAIDSEGKILSPYTAKLRRIAYMSPFYGDLVLTRETDQAIIKIERGIELFRLPAMLGSVMCNLYEPNSKGIKEEYQAMYASDPLGYFIVNGDRVIINNENLRFNTVLCYYQSDELISIITCNIVTRTSQVQMIIRKTTKKEIEGKAPPAGPFHPHTYGLYLKLFGTDYNSSKGTKSHKRVIPAFLLHFAFGLTLEEVYAMILRHIPVGEDVNPVINRLLAAVSESVSIGDPWSYIGNLNQEVKFDSQYDLSEEDTVEEREYKLLEMQRFYQQVRERIHHYLFPQMNDMLFTGLDELQRWQRIERLKLELLTLMIIEPTRFLVGTRPLDDRDDVSNKRIQDAGRALHTLVSTGWENSSVVNGNKNASGVIALIRSAPDQRDPEDDFKNILSAISLTRDGLNADFVTAMNTGNWYTKNHPLPRTGATMLVKAEQNNPLSKISSIVKIEVGSSNKSRAVGPRDVHPSSFGCFCPFQTPDSQNIGLRRYLGVLVRVTSTGNTDVHLELLKDDIIYSPDGLNREQYMPIIFNGRFLGWVDGEATAAKLRSSRRGEIYPIIDQETLVVIDQHRLIVSTDPERLVRPLFRVNPATHKLFIEERAEQDPQIWAADPGVLIREGLLEYIDQAEINRALYVAESMDSLANARLQLERARSLVAELETDDSKEKELEHAQNNLAYLLEIGLPTHCEVDPMAILGTTAASIPYLSMNQAPRAALQAKMGEQSMGVTPIFPDYIHSTKTLASPSIPLSTTHVAVGMGMDQAPVGRSVTIAIMADSYGQEDSFVFSQSLIDSHALDEVAIHTQEVKLENKANAIRQYMGPRLAEAKAKMDEEDKMFHAVDVQTGMPIIGAYVRPGDVIAIKHVIKYSGGMALEPEVHPQLVDNWKEGYIWAYYPQKDGEGNIVWRIIIKQVRAPRVGDKFAFRPAQKGTLGLIRATEDMPEIIGGDKIDVIFNPHAIPSRGTLSTLIEILTGKNSLIEGKRQLAYSYRKPLNLDEIGRTLYQYGYQHRGMQACIDGTTGEMFKVLLFTGVAYIQALPHNTIDKVKATSLRELKPIHPHTRAMRAGRDSGCKIDAMSRWAIVGHRANEIFKATARDMPAPSLNAYCTVCGDLAVPRIVEIAESANMTFYCPRCKDEGQFGQAAINHSVVYLSQLFTMFGLKINFDVAPASKARRQFAKHTLSY